MAFTDAGSQLGKSLGEKCDTWSKRLTVSRNLEKHEEYW